MPCSTPQTVLVIDSSEVIRIGIRQILSRDDLFLVVGEASDPDDGIEKFNALKPDIVVADVMLPDCKGTSLLRQLQAADHRARVFVLSGCESEGCLMEAFSHGVDGFVAKDESAEHILDALHEVANGRTVLDPRLTEQVVNFVRDGSTNSASKLIDGLSAQERRVLEHVARGMSNRQVAEALSLSEKTIKNYFSNVLSKLSVSRRTEAAMIYWKYESSR